MNRNVAAGLVAMVCAAGGVAPGELRAQQSSRLSLGPVSTLDQLAATQPVGPAPIGPEQKETSPAQTSYGLTGDWLGVRDGLGERKVFFGGYALFDLARNFRGGLDTASWPTSYLLDLHVLAQSEPLGWVGGSFFFDVQTHDQSGNGDTIVGDIQGYDNLVGPRYVQVAQLWYRQVIGDFALKIGKIDANTDAAPPGQDAYDGFSIIEHGLDFLQSSAAYSPAMVPMATYPFPAPGVQLFYRRDGFYAGAGAFYSNSRQAVLVFSGHPEAAQIPHGGMFLIGETGVHSTITLPGVFQDVPVHAGLGGWYHTGTFPDVAGTGSHNGTGGTYLFYDQALIQSDSLELGFFLIAGISDKASVPIDQNVAFGISGKLLPRIRPDDSCGVMTSWVHLPAQPGLRRPFEMATELFYKFQLTHWASLKPSFQYINSPGGRHPDAAVLTLRAEVDF